MRSYDHWVSLMFRFRLNGRRCGGVGRTLGPCFGGRVGRLSVRWCLIGGHGKRRRRMGSVNVGKVSEEDE